MHRFRTFMETHQTAIYFVTVVLAALTAQMFPNTASLEVAITPALALRLFVTFLQLPMTELGKSFSQLRFLAALLCANFIFIPLFIFSLLPLLPDNPLIRFGMLLVLLAPCIDYVVTFSQIGRADAPRLLAATPVLLLVQMLALPLYLGLFLDQDAVAFVHLAPFLQAFIWLIVLPLLVAAMIQWGSFRHQPVKNLSAALSFLPVPATALVLFVVVAAVTPQLQSAWHALFAVLPFYVLYAIVAPTLGWLAGKLFRLDSPGGRAVAFSAGTRNSLVVLPLALAMPDASDILPAIIVSQTLVELLSELIYIRMIPRLNASPVWNKG
ncbi:ACR3 family arsenite efflux pump ArsB|uniref:ACR3 family arsenite efflux pump ArsB n=1 Tax=Brenneria salicis ATCC 15712 = DSM 30166 TaxID=714314 RepID=A0A366HYA8_9GAMM|nr:arsenic resistance protein [Brenneria salicis]NMN91676.1 ACR3 family arsenite efflux pump ArsB [Brenneria salicis ATCC 15712 = DSM 30166]RBP57479.1 ACR3 family arsenite efflux pump ArsB [Brenneria salicis ATCC 15712 = DSM 30166]RLM28566.1 arsenic resistance protein [Brenneria salicis ATCC 15712 = DSM 30166]